MKFIIHGRLTSLNEYIKDCRSNVYMANKVKKKNQEAVKWAILGAKIPKVDKYPIALEIAWYEPNSRRDVDNICFAVKFILDAMVEMGIIKDDSQKYVKSVNHKVSVDAKNPRIEVTIRGYEK